MKRWAGRFCVALALMVSAAGCGGGGEPVAPTLNVTLAPSTATVLVGSFFQFSVGVNLSVDTVTFTVNDKDGGDPTVGTITSEGVYQAPATVPANTTITVKVTVGDSALGTSASATATVTLDSGVRVSIVPATFTIGAGEQFHFCARVSGVPSNPATSGACNSDDPAAPAVDVTWSVTGSGTIDSHGNYTAPAAAGTATITATSVYDTTRTATATVTIIAPVDPTLTSISNTVGAVGALFQDIYLAGTNFISTTKVLLNGVEVDPTTDIALVSPTVLRVRLKAADLDTAGPFTFSVAQKGPPGGPAGTPQSCATAALCQLVLSVKRPAIVGISPDTFPQGSATLTVNGGYFGAGAPASPEVTAQFGGQAASGTVVSARQIDVGAGGADANTPGLVPVSIASSVPGPVVPPAVVNVAVQPVYASPPSAPTTLPVGTQPSAVAINTATGVAVVANRNTHSVALIDLTTPTPTVLGFICSGVNGATLSPVEPVCPVSPGAFPVSVAVDNLRNIALVANSGTSPTTCSAATGCSVAVVNLATQSVSSIIPSGPTSIADVPAAVGINPLTGLAVVAYQIAGFASIIDLKPPPPAFPAVIGVVAVGTGATPRVAVSPKLNWALITPGGSGTLAIVDLGRGNVDSIASASCSGSTVTITTTAAHKLRATEHDPVLITDVIGGTGFNGTFGATVTGSSSFTYTSSGCSGSGAGGKARYSVPVAQVVTSVSLSGVAINDETQQAILVDETGTAGTMFSLLDQTFNTVTGLASPGSTAVAFNPLANIAVIVNRINTDASVINPATPAVLNNSTFSSGLNEPVAVDIDPVTNKAVIVNRTGNSVSIFSLSPIRPLHVLQVSRQVSAPDLWAPPDVLVNSALAPPLDQTLTIIGSGFSASSVVRLDGTNLATTFDSLRPRQLTATVPAAMLTAGPRRYALDVANGGTISNAASLTVIQSVDVTGMGCSAPAPQGVAIDSRRNRAVVSKPGCNSVSLIDLDTGTVLQTLPVGTNPQGVAVHTESGLAVVANQGSTFASIVDFPNSNVVPVNTDPGPTGVAIDQSLGRAVVTASTANVIDLFTVTGSDHSVTSLAVQARPVAVAVDPERHLAAVANTTSNTVSLVDLMQTNATEHIAVSGLPAGMAFDPETTTFLTVTSLGNQILDLDPVSRSTFFLRAGINPTSIAYNFVSSTLVTTNTASQTLTVVDFLKGRVRAVLGLGVLGIRPSGQFAVDIHPFSNLAVIADSTNNRVVLLPLPR